jgi:hypothetical protein
MTFWYGSGSGFRFGSGFVQIMTDAEPDPGGPKTYRHRIRIRIHNTEHKDEQEVLPRKNAFLIKYFPENITSTGS